MIGLAVAIMIAMGFIYILTTPPSFTATTTMIIDTKKVQLFQQQSMFSDMPIDAGTVESQVEILKSETIASGRHQATAPYRGSRIHQPRRRADRHVVGRGDADCLRPASRLPNSR